MSTITGQINLLKFRNARRVQAANQKGIFIPIEDNPTIFDGCKGCYANIRIVEKPSEFNGIQFSHFIALDLKKEERDRLASRLSDQELRSLTPILGNLREWKAEHTYESVDLEDVNDDLPFDR